MNVQTVDLILRDAAGNAVATATAAFAYVHAPVITRIDPATGPAAGGTPVTITGENFAQGLTVHFGEAVATDVVVSEDGTSITCVTPPLG